ncbi:MAG: acyltransferase [Bacteroidales bacterium]|jgi:hypothetical protein|nr:acyltransferase [Bacteroidales bacterium]
MENVDLFGKSITDLADNFEDTALHLFHFQYKNNLVYQEYCNRLRVDITKVKSIYEIPFLPVSFFKMHDVVTTKFAPEIVFTSSSTTGLQNARHLVKDLSLYEQSFMKGFVHFYGDPADYTFLCLLPGYLEREGSSLIYMMDYLTNHSKNPESGFFLYDHEELWQRLQSLKKSGKKSVLFGVSFALLDFAERYAIDFPELTVFETGGMKGRRKELVKEELHAILQTAFGVDSIHSEYGMCELLSQAYSQGNNVFFTPPWMKLLLRDEKDPLFVNPELSSGQVNVIDLANIYSCAFLATDDLGKRRGDGMEIIGRSDHSEIRGCSLLLIH